MLNQNLHFRNFYYYLKCPIMMKMAFIQKEFMNKNTHQKLSINKKKYEVLIM